MATNKYTEDALNILTAMSIAMSITENKNYKGEKNYKDWIIKNISKLNKNNDIKIIELIEQHFSEKIDLDKFNEKRKKIQEKIDYLIDNNLCSGVVVLSDKNFPKIKGNVPFKEQVICLFYKGNLDLLHEKCVTVIGHLNPDKNIINIEEKIIDELCNNNINIISGLALGCDSIAHQQTLKNFGKTIAILPSSLDDILPKKNRELANNIVENNGLLVTEYLTPLSFSQDKYKFIGRFIERDRLQALFSDGVILSASYDENDKDSNGKKCDSGSRHAMEKAKKYKIKRAVIYSDKLLSKLNDKSELNLNRKLKDNDKTIIIIDEDNIHKSVQELLKTSVQQELLKTSVQQELF